MKFVSLETAKSHIYVTHDEDDVLINLYIEAASASVKNYLKEGVEEFLDSTGEVITNEFAEPIVPAEVKIATLLLVGIYFKDRDENANGIFEMGYLPKPVTAILYPLRKPACA